MACNNQPTDCRPNCPDTPEPVLPRCDIALPDGVYTNATVTVEDGCIVLLESGRPPQYAPPDCCDEGGGGGGGNDEPCDCPPGDPGENATIAIGQVFSVAPGAPAVVENIGTDVNAILQFYIPRGTPGQDASNITGFTGFRSGITFEDGLVKSLPATGPVMYLTGQGTPLGVSVDFSDPDSDSGLVTCTVDISSYDSMLRSDITNAMNNADNSLQAQITALQNLVTNLSNQVAALSSQVATCC